VISRINRTSISIFLKLSKNYCNMLIIIVTYCHKIGKEGIE